MENVGKVLQEKMRTTDMRQRYQKLVTKALADPDVKTFLQAHRAELTQEDIERSASKLYEYVKIKENIAQGKEIPMPGYSPSLMQLARQTRVRTINMPKSIRRARIEDYDQTKRQDVLMAALAFIDAYQEQPQEFHKGMYLQGKFGVGKTFLLAAIANELAANGFKSTLVHFPSFAVEIKSAIGENNTKQLIDEIKKAPVLMLDDIGAEQLSSWLRDDVLGVILQYRMQEELPTFFSSNLAMAQLESEYLTVNNRGEAEPVKARRIMERIRFLASEYLVEGPNRRQK